MNQILPGCKDVSLFKEIPQKMCTIMHFNANHKANSSMTFSFYTEPFIMLSSRLIYT